MARGAIPLAAALVFAGLVLGGPAGADAPPLEHRLSTLFEEVSPAVVSVVCYRAPIASQAAEAAKTPEERRRHYRRMIASGAVIDPQGCVVTTDMVAQPGDSLFAHLSDGRQIPLSYQGANEDLHIALLHLEGPGPFPYLGRTPERAGRLPEWVAAIAYGPWRGRRPGEPALALAHRNAIETARIPCGDSVETAWRVMAPFLPGNAGGALVTLGGRWIGLITGVISQGRPPLAAAGTNGSGPWESGVIVPAELVVAAVREIRSCEEPEVPVSGFLGVSTYRRPPAVRDSLLRRSSGVVVSHVLTGSPGDRAGILAGDVILKLEDAVVEDAAKLTELLAQTPPGTLVDLHIQRSGVAHRLRVRLGDRAVWEQVIEQRLRRNAEQSALRSQIAHHRQRIKELRQQLFELEARSPITPHRDQSALERTSD